MYGIMNPMTELYDRTYKKEEKFLDDYPNVSALAVKLLKGDWEPNYSANDSTRKNQEYFLPLGQIDVLVFDSAMVNQENNVFSSVQIILKSSYRQVNVRVKSVNGQLKGERVYDRLVPKT
jgi:hypothetical protein